jgi:geranylgeranylglycerol-phosphate geranylgeranyltransferase
MGLFKMMRPGNCAMALLGVFIGAMVELFNFFSIFYMHLGGSYSIFNRFIPNSPYWGLLTLLFPSYGSLPIFIPIFFAALAAFLVTGAGNVLNDFYDAELDKKAHPERPIPSGEVSPKSAWNFAMTLFAGGLILAVLVNWICVIFVFVNTGLLFTYERSLKAKGLSGNITISYLTASVFLFGGASIVSFVFVPILFLLALLANVSREITKDIEDMEADAAYRRTLPMILGRSLAARTAGKYLKAAVVLSFLPLIIFLWPGAITMMMVKVMGYIAVVIVADFFFLSSIGIISINPHEAQFYMKVGMMVAMIAFFLLGALPVPMYA